MAARGTRDRRPSIWPGLVMALVVLAAFYTLKRVHERPGPAVVPPAEQSAPAAPAPGQ
jgi:hypothetical protein